ncbi:hypothetical protein RQP54_19485 [Curvibacter sp. APW13]|uniref:hypothetical protein n=1 Tax=Curvibacter sp. APW13 TaxID=3077236 RepID=UPI0028DE0E2D|nr:hypothetical protein [Curvibacter sp. APW13]MDT8993065.1 hypothetical protein [Curvibacter sp. APW13]
MFLGAVVLWLLLAIYLTVNVPRWLGLQRPKARLLRSLLLPLLLVGPLADHLIGMWQFEKICAEDGRLEISPAAANTKRARELDAQSETLKGYAIPIDRQVRRIIDLDTGEQIAQYKYFSTSGGVVGSLPELGGRFTCSAHGRSHIDSEKFDALAAQTNLTYGESK